MKKLICVAIVGFLMLAIGSRAKAAVVILEDFESGIIGNTLDLDGWQDAFGPNDVLSFETADSSLKDANTSGKVGDCNGTGGDIWKAFTSANTITDNDPNVYVKITAFVNLPGQPFLVGPRNGAAKGAMVGPMIGQAGVSEAGYVAWELQKAGSGGAPVYGDNAQWGKTFELLLQIKVNQTSITASTGTLYYRELGQTAWTQDSILHDVNLGLTSHNKPSLWASWHLRAQYNGSFDNLTLGTGDIHVCEPPQADLNEDCQVDSLDMEILASQWLECSEPNSLDCN